MGQFSTVTLAEIRATMECCHVIKGKATINITIRSDSQAATKTLSSAAFKSQTPLECRAKLNDLDLLNSIKSL